MTRRPYQCSSLALAIALLGPAGVSAQPVRVDGPEAVRYRGTAYLSDSDLLSAESGARFRAAQALVRARQCDAQMANPLVYMALPVQTNELPSTGARPSTASARDSAGDGVLNLLPVSTFPNEYLKNMTAFLATPGLPQGVVQKLRGEMTGNYEKLHSRVQELMNSYNPGECSPLQSPALYRTRAEIIFVPPNP